MKCAICGEEGGSAKQELWGPEFACSTCMIAFKQGQIARQEILEQQLATPAGLKGLRVCYAEPAAIVFLDYGGNGAVLQTELADGEPLYRAWGPKP